MVMRGLANEGAESPGQQGEQRVCERAETASHPPGAEVVPARLTDLAYLFGVSSGIQVEPWALRSVVGTRAGWIAGGVSEDSLRDPGAAESHLEPIATG